MKTIAKLSAVLLAAAAFAVWPAMAQPDTNAPPPSTNAPAPPRPRAMQFRGMIESVDAATMTLSLRGRGGNPGAKVMVTSKTRIRKDGQPGEFADAVQGMRVSGSGKKGEDGVWTANTLNIMTRPPRPKPVPATPDATPPSTKPS